MIKRIKALKKNQRGSMEWNPAVLLIAIWIVIGLIVFAAIGIKDTFFDNQKNGNEPSGKAVETVPDWLQG